MYKLDVKIQDVNRKKGEIKRGERRERDNKAKKLLGNVLYSIQN